jgi:hypothetical protein
VLPNRIVSKSIASVKGGYGLVGEIILDQLGLTASEQKMPKDVFETVQFKLKSIIKRWAIQRLDIEGLLHSEKPKDQSGTNVL